MENLIQKTLVLIKHDAVRRKIVGVLISQLEQIGLEINAVIFVDPDKVLIERHYEEHKDKHFYPPLVAFMTSGPCYAIELEGVNAVKRVRTHMGSAKDPAPGTIRHELGVPGPAWENMMHASDSVESAAKELKLWFGDM